MPVYGNQTRSSQAYFPVTNIQSAGPHRPSIAGSDTEVFPVAVALDTIGDHGASAAGTTGGSTVTWTHIIGDGPNRVVYVGVDIGSSSDATQTASVTFGGTSMTSVGKVHANNSNGGYVQLFRLIAPPIQRATVVVTIASAPIDIVAGSVSYFNVDQTTPETITTAFGSSTLASVANDSAPGNMALLLVGGGSSFNAQPNNSTALYLSNRSGSSACGNSGMSQAPGARGLTETWTLASDFWAAIGANLLATGAADPTFTIATPIWTGDYETGDLSQNIIGGNGSYLPSTPTVVTASPTPQQGTYAGKYVVPAGTSVAGAGVNPRCEDTWNRQRDIQEGDDLWFGGWIMIDSTFVDPAAGQFCVVTQWKNEGTGSPPLELAINNDTGPCHWRIDGGFGYPTGSQQWVASDNIAIVRNTWIRWDFHVVFSSDPTVAMLNVWKDGVQVVTNYQTGTLAGFLYPSQTTYWKRGIYRSEAKTTQDIIYHDGWLAGRTAASVNFPSSTPDTGTGSLTLSGSASGSASDTATGSLTFGGSAATSAPATATGSLSFGGTAATQAPDTATGSLTFGGTASTSSPDTGTGSLTFAGTASTSSPDTATGSLTFAGTGATTVPATGTGSLTFAGTAIAGFATSGTGSMSLAGSATAASPATATGSLTFAGTGAAKVAATATGSLTFAGSGAATVSATASGSLTFAGTAATSATNNTGSGSLTLAGTGTAKAAASGSGSLVLAGSGTGTATDTATGSLTFSGTGTAVGPNGAGGTGSLTVAGSATALAGSTGAGSLVFGGSAAALPGGSTGGGSLTFTGTATPKTSIAATGAMSFSAALTSAATAAATGTMVILGAGAGSATAQATAHIDLLGAATATPLLTSPFQAWSGNGWVATQRRIWTGASWAIR
jgi:hypothetical protein